MERELFGKLTGSRRSYLRQIVETTFFETPLTKSAHSPSLIQAHKPRRILAMKIGNKLFTGAQTEIQEKGWIFRVPANEALDWKISRSWLEEKKRKGVNLKSVTETKQRGENNKCMSQKTQTPKRTQGEQKEFACFREMGKVSRPHCSGVFTASLVTSLHDLQIEAQATTSLRDGHKIWLTSTRFIMWSNNSGGKLAHGPCRTASSCQGVGTVVSGAMCDLPWRHACLRLSFLHAMPPIPPCIS